MMERGLGSLRGQAAAASGALAATALARALVTVAGTAVETPYGAGVDDGSSASVAMLALTADPKNSCQCGQQQYPLQLHSGATCATEVATVRIW